MKYDRYYARSEGFYNFLYSLVPIFLCSMIELIHKGLILGFPFLVRIVSRFSLLLSALMLVIFVSFLNRAINAAYEPKFCICSHFLIMGYCDNVIIPWNEIYSVHITGDKIKISYNRDSSKKERRESIKNVTHSELLVQEIKKYCEKYGIDFSEKVQKSHSGEYKRAANERDMTATCTCSLE